jgi:hypothetical protein
LVATLVLLQVERYDRDGLYALGELLGVKDSKQASGFGRMAAAESVALALLERQRGRTPRDADDLLAMVSLADPRDLRAGCPEASAPQCWSVQVSLPAFGGSADRGHETLDGLARAGVLPLAARSAVVCASALNAERGRLGSKLAVDLLLFERLLLFARSSVAHDLTAYCGMVGGLRRYRDYFQELGDRGVETLQEGRGLCRYRVSGLGEVAFEVDADAHHLPVGMASMLGKYVREVVMERQNRFYLGHDPSLGRVSGYHDPVTRAFVERSRELRTRLGIAGECFER